MIMVKATKDTEAGIMPEEKLIADMAKFHEDLAKAGALLDASGFQPSSKGMRIRYSGGKRTVTDGPFAETKELVAGYTIIQEQKRSNGPNVFPLPMARTPMARSKFARCTS
jgi:hypothetical protein